MCVPRVQTKREIQALLTQAGLGPRKRFGQHFLIDGNLMRRLASSAQLDADDLVLEVGGGTGGLTDLLAGCGARCLCVEIDRDLHAMLEERFHDAPHIELIRDDILAGKHRLASTVAELIRSHGKAGGGCVKLVANLPYQVATPLVMNLLVDYPEVRRLCFTVQAEVGERLAAPPACKAYGPLSILSQCLAHIEVLARLSPAVFWPRPAVSSVMIRMDVVDSPFGDLASLHRFAALVRGAFEHRRKTLRSALGYILDDASLSRVCHHVDTTRRPESFSVEEWLAIHRVSSAG